MSESTLVLLDFAVEFRDFVAFLATPLTGFDAESSGVTDRFRGGDGDFAGEECSCSGAASSSPASAKRSFSRSSSILAWAQVKVRVMNTVSK